MCLNGLGFYPETETAGLMTPCMSVLQGLNMSASANEPTLGQSGADALGPNAALLSTLKFAFSGRPAKTGRDSLILQYETDPAESWAPCCEDDSCDVAFLADESEACALDADCVGGLFCDGGICALKEVVEPPPTSGESDAPEEQSDTDEGESEAEDTSSANIGVSGLVAILFRSSLALVFL